MALADSQARRIEEERPTVKFLNILKEFITSCEVCTKFIDPVAGNVEEDGVPADGFIGLQDSEWYYLLPDTVYKVVVQFATVRR